MREFFNVRVVDNPPLLFWSSLATLAMGAIALLIVFSSDIDTIDSTLQNKVDQIEMNEQIYTVAYNTFIASHEPLRALHIAEKALSVTPNNLLWCRRLAAIAVKAGRPHLAIKEWLNIAKISRDAKALDKAIQLAKRYHDNHHLLMALNYKLSLYPSDKQVRIDKARVLRHVSLPVPDSLPATPHPHHPQRIHAI